MSRKVRKFKTQRLLKKQMLSQDSRVEISKPQHVGQPPVFVNKVLLAHGHAHSFMYNPWLLLCYNSRAE